MSRAAIVVDSFSPVRAGLGAIGVFFRLKIMLHGRTFGDKGAYLVLIISYLTCVFRLPISA